MERKNRLLTLASTVLLGVTLFGCSKTASEPEIQGPKETIIMNMVDVSNNKNVGTLYIDNMNGRAQARIEMNNGTYTSGTNMKTNITFTDANGTAVYALCQDVNGNDGKCKTFPITIQQDKSDALYEKIISTNGLAFNVLDKNNNVYATSAKHTIVIDN